MKKNHDCISRVRNELKAADPSLGWVKFDLSTIKDTSKNSTGIKMTGQIIEFSYKHKKKDGMEIEKTGKSFVTHDFCPFCGEKYSIGGSTPPASSKEDILAKYLPTGKRNRETVSEYFLKDIYAAMDEYASQAAASVKGEQEWFSVTKSLPEVGKEVLVAIEWADLPVQAYLMENGRWSGSREVRDFMGDGYCENPLLHKEHNVTHWMPLPAPPKV